MFCIMPLTVRQLRQTLWDFGAPWSTETLAQPSYPAPARLCSAGYINRLIYVYIYMDIKDYFGFGANVCMWYIYIYIHIHMYGMYL